MIISGGMPTIFVSDIDAAVRFYTETLGLRLIQQYGPHFASIDAGQGVTIGLHPASANNPAGRSGSITLGFMSSDPIRDSVATLKSRGVVFLSEVIDDGQLFLDLADFHLEVDVGGKARGQDDVLANALLEPAQFERHRVRADRHARITRRVEHGGLGGGATAGRRFVPGLGDLAVAVGVEHRRAPALRRLLILGRVVPPGVDPPERQPIAAEEERVVVVFGELQVMRRETGVDQRELLVFGS